MPATQSRSAPAPEIPPGRAEVEIVGSDRFLKGWLAEASDLIFKASDFSVVLGSIAAAAFLGYQVASRAENLREITPLPALLYRSSYTPAAVYELFEELGPEGRAEYQFLNVLSTGAFPFLAATFFALCIGRTYQRAGLGHDWNLFPYVFAVAATIESLGVSWLLHSYPEVHVQVAAVMGMVAGLKIRFLSYAVIMLLVGVVWAGKCYVQEKVFKKRQ